MENISEFLLTILYPIAAVFILKYMASFGFIKLYYFITPKSRKDPFSSLENVSG